MPDENSTITENAYSIAQYAEGEREDILQQISDQLTEQATGDNDTTVVSVDLGNGVQMDDITNSASPLVLDDYMNQLSTLDQTAAQVVAAKNRSAQQTNRIMG